MYNFLQLRSILTPISVRDAFKRWHWNFSERTIQCNSSRKNHHLILDAMVLLVDKKTMTMTNCIAYKRSWSGEEMHHNNYLQERIDDGTDGK
jgi:hypothetical protein